MEREAIQPLRILKGSSYSPSKMPGSTSTARPLSEINPMGIRRNSGNLNATPQLPKHDSKHDSSPFDPSPGSNPTLAFWRNKESLSPGHVGNENVPFRQPSPSPERRSSLENLKRASRVHNNIFARDHDQDPRSYPTPPADRQFGRGRPLGARPESSLNGANNTMDRTAVLSGPFRGMGELETRIPWLGRTSPPKWSPSRPTSSPTKEQYSPQKSSLSSNIRYATATHFGDVITPSGDEDSGERLGHSTTPRPIIRQPKSVSFDIAPPQINEYEEITPDPSSVASGSREGSYDSDTCDLDDGFEQEQHQISEDSFDDSLEDVDKTPIVMPEDWRFMTPDNANTDLAQTFEDPFGSGLNRQLSPQRRSLSAGNEVSITRSESVKSSGEHRPLPPLPGISSDSSDVQLNLNAGATPKATRSLANPHTASNLKVGGRSTRDSPMPWEDRFRLLSIQNQSTEVLPMSPSTSEQVPDEVNPQPTEPSKDGKEPSQVGTAAIPEFRPPSRISRESILRKVRSKQSSFDAGYDDYSFADETDETEEDQEQIEEDEIEYEYAHLDPDVPIPSREKSESYEDATGSSQVEYEDYEDDDHEEHNRLGGSDDTEHSSSQSVDEASENSALNRELKVVDIREEYQSSAATDVLLSHTKDSISAADNLPKSTITHFETSIITSATTESSIPSLPKVSSHQNHNFGEQISSFSNDRMTLPDFSTFTSKSDFGLGLETFLLPSPPEEHQGTNDYREPTKKDRPLSPERPITPITQIDTAYPRTGGEDEEDEEISTPDSVIHHPVEMNSPEQESPIISELVATIKAPGAKLKTRPSATPADIRAMAAARRLVSEEKPLPSLPDEGEDSDEDIGGENDVEDTDEEFKEATTRSNAANQHVTSFQVKLDIPLQHDTVDHGFGLEKEFDRVMEAQKRGYIMRENAKVVVASNRKASDDTTSVESVQSENQPSPTRRTKGFRRPSQQTWKAEPWNGKTRRQSTRYSTIVPEKGMLAGSIPPLPGTESATAGQLVSLAEDEASIHEQDPDGSERGRLFVKVVGVKELDLPLPKDERCHFQLTLDNGLHCVTTNWAELGRTAPVGQEFELVVFEDLEFQLTLQTRLEQPKSIAPSIDTSTTQSSKMTKVSKFKNLLRSPQKRRELEQKQRDEEEAYAAHQKQREIDLQRACHRPTAWDLQHEIVGHDGSFARAYVSLSNYEKQAFGRPYNVDVPCFNEWAVEDKSITSSTRSKLGGMQRRPPYKIGKIELQLLYIPKPKGVQDEDMPRSISAAMRQLKEAETKVEQQHEGVLSQEGGDCPFWRRRFFKLQGTRLTAYHESTRQLRATINLAKATQLIDDRSSLTRTPDLSTSSSKGKSRRKSAFAEDEEGYMFVEEGFRIRFANGESIDFYADSPQEKEQWMKALNEVVGKNGTSGKVTWMDTVLARERVQKARAATEKPNTLKEESLPLRGASKPKPASPMRKPVGGGATNTSGSDGGPAPGIAREKVSMAAQQSPQKHWSMPPVPNSQESPGKRLEKRRQAVRSTMF